MWKVTLLTKAKKLIDTFILLNVSQILTSKDNTETIQITFQQYLNKDPLIIKFTSG